MITKSEGAKDSCPSCKQELVCRTVEFKGNTKLQWQYKDREEAHFSYDFKTGKSSCKESAQAGNEAGAKVTAPDKTHLKNIDLDIGQITEIQGVAYDVAKRMVVVLNAVETVCEGAGITNPAKIGMIYNQVCEQRRYSGQ